MWAAANSTPSNIRAVSVVPMPSVVGSFEATSVSRSSIDLTTPASVAARSTPVRSIRRRSTSSSRTTSTAVALATSPCGWPPMPSATASRRELAYSESSLIWRRLPTSDPAAYRRTYRSCVMPP